MDEDSLEVIEKIGYRGFIPVINKPLLPVQEEKEREVIDRYH